MRRFFSCFFLLCAPGVFAQAIENAAVRRAVEELDRTRAMVTAGAAPRASLETAERAVAEAQDDVIVAHTLYGKIGVEDLTEEQAGDMVAAARRQLEREKLRLDDIRKLVDAGVTARSALTPVLEDLESRRLTLNLALSRAKLIGELAAMAKVEAVAAESDQQPSDLRVAERFDGNGLFRDSEYKKVVLAFEKKFSHPLPVSARGETALHRALGFDHRGRVDIALNPDESEGVWLRQYLAVARIPYFAFRAAVPGQATAPHIHLGPPSLRLRAAD
ncbi:MAG: hypothetical protein ABJF23_21520 [Bryobacteraceae bacterium]